MIYEAALYAYCGAPQQVSRIMWWNVENLFDCEDDSLVQDEEFLPESARHWTKHRYYKKIGQIGRVISSMGDVPPVIIGLGEVEGEKPLRDLTQYTLKNLAPYKYICTHGQDRRGIQVGMIYDPRYFTLLDIKEVDVSTNEYKTRNYLYATGVLMRKDTIDLYLCHWPSQWGGTRATEHKRLSVARKMEEHVLLTRCTHPERKIILIGDFNEEVDSPALTQLMKGCDLIACIASATKTDFGTHRYKGQWSVLDHMLVSQNLYPKILKAGIWKAPLLLEKDTRGCSKPYRTYLGSFYHGGYSDHLPVYLDVTK